MRIINLTIVALFAAVAGCSATHHAADVGAASDTTDLTVGTVQKEIRLGMSAAEVAEVLGSPNIVTTDEERRESWIYDKISTNVAYSRSQGGIVGLVFGGAGGGAGAGSNSAGATSTSQQTLTVVVKYDDTSRVRDFSYHSSRF